MTFRSSSLFLSVCLSLAACDGGSDSDATGGGTTSGGDDNTASETNQSSISISVSATTPSTDPSTTDVTATGTEGATTDPSAGDSSSEGGSSSGRGEESSSGSTGGETGVTIYDVQDGTVAEGETVMIEGVVITGLRVGVGVFVQEIDGGEYSGVYVDTGDVDLGTFAVGDIVDLSGVVTEALPANNPAALAGLTGIIADTFVATGSSMELSPEVVDLVVLADADTAEPWEGVLVQVSGSFTAVTAMNNPRSVFGEFSEFSIEEGEASVRVDDFLYNIFAEVNAADFPGFAEGATFTDVSGVLNFSFGNHKIAPRSASEYEGYVAPAG